MIKQIKILMFLFALSLPFSPAMASDASHPWCVILEKQLDAVNEAIEQLNSGDQIIEPNVFNHLRSARDSIYATMENLGC